MIFGRTYPTYGDTKHSRRYAWLPTPLTDGRWAWLEWVRVTDTWMGHEFHPMGSGPGEWVTTRVELLASVVRVGTDGAR